MYIESEVRTQLLQALRPVNDGYVTKQIFTLSMRVRMIWIGCSNIVFRVMFLLPIISHIRAQSGVLSRKTTNRILQLNLLKSRSHKRDFHH
jgi:hypothetical protein